MRVENCRKRIELRRADNTGAKLLQNRDGGQPMLATAIARHLVLFQGKRLGVAITTQNSLWAGRTRKLEMVRENGNESVIGESGVAMSAGRDVRDAAAAIAFNSPWAVHRNRVAAETVHDSGIDRDDVPGTAETVAGAESVANGNALHAPAEADRKVAHAGDSMGEAAAEKILVSDGHD